MLEIPAIVTSAWTMIQPLLPVIAIKGAEKLGEAAGSDLWNAIKNKFDGEAHAQKAMLRLIKDPGNSDVQAAFRVALQEVLEEDPAFAEKLANLLPTKVEATYNATLTGDGAIAQGENAKAVGAGGIMIGGNVSGGVHLGEKKEKK